MVKNRSKNSFLKSPMALVMGLIIIAGALVTLGLELTNTTYIFHKRPQSKAIVTVGKPVVPPKPAPTSQATRDLNTNTSQPGGATDTHGSATPSTNSNQWTVSGTGYITVKSPLANAKLQDGSVI